MARRVTPRRRSTPKASTRPEPQPEAARRPVLEGASLRLDDERIPLRSGAMHYWRLAPEHWAAGLEQLKSMGLPIVDTYAPWGVHELPNGELDFGETDPRKDLGKFLDLAGETGLYVFLRPGPHINAELTYFGLPERIVVDPDCQARSPRGNPVILFFPPKMFPVPSHASEAYHEELGRWYDAVAEVVIPRLWPKGPVVLLQVDNEAGFFFRNGPFCQDYHDDAVGRWHSFLETRHGDLARVAQAHDADYQGWSEVTPPARFEVQHHGDLVRQLEWAEFQEHLLAYAIGRMRRRMDKSGMKGPPLVHNVSLGDGGLPVSVPGLEQEVDLVGFDYYHPAREHRIIKRRTLYLAGTVETPYAPELGIGAPPWFTPMSHEDSLYCAMAAAAFGLRGFNLYMAVDRDRWYGAAIDMRGKRRPEAREWAAFIAALNDVEHETLTRETRVTIVIPKEYQRLSRATHLLGAVSPSTLEALGGSPVDACRADKLGFREAIQIEWWRLVARMADALTTAQVPYAYVDGDAPLERFERFDVVFAPSFEMASKARWEKLRAASQHGTHVVYGPRLPHLDDQLQKCEMEPLGRAPVSIDDDNAAHALVHHWIGRFGLERPYSVLPPIETTVHRQGDKDRVLFVMNPQDRSRTARVSLPQPCQLRDLITDETFSGADEAVLPMRARTCRMLEITLESSP